MVNKYVTVSCFIRKMTRDHYLAACKSKVYEKHLECNFNTFQIYLFMYFFFPMAADSTRGSSTAKSWATRIETRAIGETVKTGRLAQWAKAFERKKGWSGSIMILEVWRKELKLLEEKMAELETSCFWFVWVWKTPCS